MATTTRHCGDGARAQLSATAAEERKRRIAEAMAAQWGRFMLTNLAGFALNRGMYVMLVVSLPFVARNPLIATAAGALAGMMVNFQLSRRVVFR
jgi:putative flippase GtrA